MTTNEQSPIQDLIAKWRAKFPASALKSSDDYYAGQANGTLKCSDELEALIATSSPPANPDWGVILCHLCGDEIVLVSSATMEMAVSQHYRWIHGATNQKERAQPLSAGAVDPQACSTGNLSTREKDN